MNEELFEEVKNNPVRLSIIASAKGGKDSEDEEESPKKKKKK